MKNIFTLLLGGLFTTAAFANDITVSVPNDRSYNVIIDGRNISGYNENNAVCLTNISLGQHSIQVYRDGGNSWNDHVIYSSYFNVRPQYDMQINVDRRGQVDINETRSHDNGWRDHDRDNNGYGRHDRNDDYGRNKDYENKRDWDNRGNDNNKGWNNNYNRAMNDYDFSRLVQRIRRQWFNKFGIAKDAMSNNYLSVGQIKQILQIFSSENEKLDLAELAYKNTVDKGYFRQLYDLFSYRAQSELDSYIRNYRY
jgi:hypothetical protein